MIFESAGSLSSFDSVPGLAQKVERQLFWNTKHTTCSAVNSRQPETAAQHSGEFQEDNKCPRFEEIVSAHKQHCTFTVSLYCMYDVPVDDITVAVQD